MEGIASQEITILIASGIVIMLSMALALILFYGRAQSKLLAQKLEAQQTLLQKTIMAQEDERSRIAKDLHDDLGSKLNVMFLYMQRLKKEQTGSEPPVLEEIQEILSTSIDTTRRISHELLPPTLQKFGLQVALQELAEGYQSSGLVTFDLQLDDLQVLVQDKMKELNLFRIFQELSKNSTLHGQAPNIMIHFSHTEQGLCFFYKDDGKGVDQSHLAQGKGLGMSNIESRLKILGGKWDYESSPGNGLKARIVFPA
ncbi:MAG: histidine kinase [Bacteroidia bacterium]|nr:histidine kinase [Bacteroidia bacterium]